MPESPANRRRITLAVWAGAALLGLIVFAVVFRLEVAHLGYSCPSGRPRGGHLVSVGALISLAAVALVLATRRRHHGLLSLVIIAMFGFVATVVAEGVVAAILMAREFCSS
jgi:hypothetical protein